MPKYLSLFRYTGEAWELMVTNPAERATEARALIEQAGGTLHEFFWMLGDFDGLAIFSMPSEQVAAAVSAAAATSNRLSEVRTYQLLDAEDSAAALTLAQVLRQHYRPPGAPSDWRKDYEEGRG